MAVGQRYIPPAPNGSGEGRTDEIFGEFLDKNGPKESFRRQWQHMTAEQKLIFRQKMESFHDRMFANFRQMPSQLMLVFRYWKTI